MRNYGQTENKHSLTADEKKHLDEVIVECIHTDSRLSNDFTKLGMRKLLELLKPGYRPMCNKTIFIVIFLGTKFLDKKWKKFFHKFHT